MLSGYAETCAQAKSRFGQEIVAVPVNEGVSRQAARLFAAAEIRRQLRDGAQEALQRRSRFSPFRLDPPYNFEVEFLNSFQTEQPMLLPGINRFSPRSVTFAANEYLEGFKIARDHRACGNHGLNNAVSTLKNGERLRKPPIDTPQTTGR
jgi:D-aminopeptidase